MKYLIVLIGIFRLSCCDAQSLRCYRKISDSLTKHRHDLVLAFLQLSPLDSIADIGTGAGYSLVPIANECTLCKFTVEDIDSSICNRSQLFKQLKKSGNQISIDNFSFHYGNEKTTGLPDGAYNKVLLFDVMHEIAFKNEMLDDVKRILQTGGSVFIEDILVHKKIKKDKGCNYPYLTESELKQILADNNYIILREQITFDNGNRYKKIFECQPMADTKSIRDGL